MMKHLFFLSIAAGTLALQSCEKNDDNGIKVGSEVQSAFDTKFPNAINVEWEMHGIYYVADFDEGNIDESAWFDAVGAWYMTESDIPYTALPQLVKAAFEASEYSAWIKDDVDMIERRDAETVYVIEVEQGNAEVELYYTATGVLVKTAFDTENDYDYEDFIPEQLPTKIVAYITDN